MRAHIKSYEKLGCQLIWRTTMSGKNILYRYGFGVSLYRVISIYLSIYGSKALVGLQFLNLYSYTDDRTPWTSDQPVARPLPRQRTTQTQNKRTQTSMPWVGIESTIPVFERAKAVHALDRAETVIGRVISRNHKTAPIHSTKYSNTFQQRILREGSRLVIRKKKM
jgi:hypothetical protein